MLEPNGRINPCKGSLPDVSTGVILMKKTLSDGQRSQSGATLLRPDLHWFCLRQSQGDSGDGFAWMSFFLLYVSLPALLYGTMSENLSHHDHQREVLLQTGRIVFP